LVRGLPDAGSGRRQEEIHRRETRENGIDNAWTESSVPGRDDDRRVKLQVWNLDAKRVTNKVTKEEGNGERSYGTT